MRNKRSVKTIMLIRANENISKVRLKGIGTPTSNQNLLLDCILDKMLLFPLSMIRVYMRVYFSQLCIDSFY